MNFETPASLDNLRQRSRLLKAARSYFDRHGLIEVQTPTLSRHTVVDRHIDPLTVEVIVPGRTASTSENQYYLQSSPEAAMKRLLACGLGDIYQIGPVYRNAERGRLHNPEFTLLEWYRIGDDCAAGIHFADRLLSELLETPAGNIRSFEQVFNDATGMHCLDATVAQLSMYAYQQKLVTNCDWSADWDDWIDLIFSLVVQPTLGFERPCFVTNFPVSQAALAMVSSSDRRTAERFELFYQGIELANGYHELQDPAVLRERSIHANKGRLSTGKAALPVESTLLAAMEHGIPNCTGCALGFDRLVMIAVGATSIDEVLTFPIELA